MLEYQKRPNKMGKGHKKPNTPRKNGNLVPNRKGLGNVKVLTMQMGRAEK